LKYLKTNLIKKEEDIEKSITIVGEFNAISLQ
jgi:hypothetical protein